MEIDLALFLRLSRTLERTEVAVAREGEDLHSEVVASLDRFLLAAEERLERLRTSEAPEPEQTVVEVEDVAQAQAEEAAVVIEEVEEAEPAAWTGDHDRLYEDVLWLFRIGDIEGALTSLRRLLDTGEHTQELMRFVEINSSKLVGQYEKLFKGFDRPLEVRVRELGELFFWNSEEASSLLDLLGRKDTLAQALADTPFGPVKTLALFHRLMTDRLVVFADQDEMRH